MGERAEAACELGGNLTDALGVSRPDAGRLVAEPQQELLVEGLRAQRALSRTGVTRRSVAAA